MMPQFVAIMEDNTVIAQSEGKHWHDVDTKAMKTLAIEIDGRIVFRMATGGKDAMFRYHRTMTKGRTTTTTEFGIPGRIYYINNNKIKKKR